MTRMIRLIPALALVAACGGSRGATEPEGTIQVEFTGLAEPVSAPSVRVIGGQNQVRVEGDFLAGCRMGPHPVATGEDDGTTVRVLLRDDTPGTCIEGNLPVRYVAWLPVLAGNRRVVVMHRGDRYRGAGTGIARDTTVVVYGDD